MGRQAGRLIERDSYVLVIVDIQERLVAAMPSREAVIGTTAKLAKVAALCGSPVIVTRQYPKGLGTTVPELEEALVGIAELGATVVGLDKTAFCCAAEESFTKTLRATGRSQVVLVGMETHICVAQTALALVAEGYDVHVVADACCSRDPEAHEVALDRMRHAGVTVTWSESVMYEAVGVAGTDEFKRLLAIVKA